MGRKSISVVIPWCDRPEVATTIAANSSWLQEFRCKLVIVNCAGNSSWLRTNLSSVKNVDISVLELPSKSFNKSLAVNLGLTIADADLILTLDADVILDDFLREAIPLCDGQSCVTLRRVRESDFVSGSQVELDQFKVTLTLRSGSHKAVVETRSVDFREGARSAPGILLTDRKHLVDVGGLNSGLASWGWEDIDLLARLQLKCALRHHQAGFGTHLSHNDDLRQFGDFKSRAESESRNSEVCISRYRTGDFEGTLEQDLLAWRHVIEARSI